MCEVSSLYYPTSKFTKLSDFHATRASPSSGFIQTTPGPGLKLIAGAGGLKRRIREPTVNRPGLVLSGFTRYFAIKRVQVIGNAEVLLSEIAAPEERAKRSKPSSPTKFPCVVFCRNLHADKSVPGRRRSRPGFRSSAARW